MSKSPSTDRQGSWAVTVGFCLFLGAAVFFLWAEHRAHLLGLLPFLILLACPFIHLFMHRGHGAHGNGHGGHRGGPEPAGKQIGAEQHGDGS